MSEALRASTWHELRKVDIRPTCSWVGCTRGAAFERTDTDGRVWAELCVDHQTELEACVATGAPDVVVQAWVKAQGGAKVAADRTFGPFARLYRQRKRREEESDG